MRSKLVQGRKSINCANSVLPAYILNPRERVPENLADTRFYVQVDTTPKAKIPSSTQQVARYSRVLSRTAVISAKHDSLATHFYAPCQGRDLSMYNAHRGHGEIAAVKYTDGACAAGHVVGLHFVAAILA